MPGTPIEWIAKAAHPLATADPSAPLDDLRPLLGMLGQASAVGYGAGTRGAHELVTLQTRIARPLVQEGGFRAVAFDQDWTLGVRLDGFVGTGKGDPRALLKDAEPFANTEEVLGLLEWMRDFNQGRPDQPVRLVCVSPHAVGQSAYNQVIDHVRRTAPERTQELEGLYAELGPGSDIAAHLARFRSLPDRTAWVGRARAAHDLVASLTDDAWTIQTARVIVQFYELHDHDALSEDPLNMAYFERSFAENLAWWHQHTGHKVLWWTSSSHASDGPGRAMSFPPAPPSALPNAGSFLRKSLGPGYASIGLTFHQGGLATYSEPKTFQVPGAAPELFESTLGADDLGDYLLDLHAEQPPEVAEWLGHTARFRAIGPAYDPDNDAAHHMTGGSPAEWFQVSARRSVGLVVSKGMGISVAVGSQGGPASLVNQDAVYAGPWLQVIATGHGRGGDIAAAEVVETMARLDVQPPEEILDETGPSWKSPLLESVESAMVQANERLGRLKRHDRRYTNARVWVTAIRWSGPELALGYVGRCRGYLIRDGEFYQITHDYTLNQPLPGPTIPDEPIFLDGMAAPDPNLSLRRGRPGERYILSTRGFAHVIPSSTGLRIIKEETSPADVVHGLIQALQAEPTPDDASCIVIDVTPSETNVKPLAAGALARQAQGEPEPSPAAASSKSNETQHQPDAIARDIEARG
ncbi:erythromycin esterase family protein [Actinomadura sp. 6N118]|uniref:erythromycin esterase family protein n=1 Tax=Actinomadura sp. 6N118 TaxID=3375151 RepID=UPI0037B648E0